MFGQKKQLIEDLRKEVTGYREKYYASLYEPAKVREEFNEKLTDLVQRLSVAAPAVYSGYSTWLNYDFIFTSPVNTFSPSTPKKPDPPEDKTPLGDLRRYVEIKEREKKNTDDKATKLAEKEKIAAIAKETCCPKKKKKAGK